MVASPPTEISHVRHGTDGPVLTPPVRSTGDITDFLSVSRLHEKLAPVYETVRQLTRALPPDVALIGYAGAPWTIAAC